MVDTYILTKEGRAFSEEGLERVRNLIEKDGDISSNLMYHMGHELNDSRHLSELLKNDTTGYLIISEVKRNPLVNRLYLLVAEDFPGICEELDMNPDDNSWDTLIRIIKDAEEEGLLKPV